MFVLNLLLPLDQLDFHEIKDSLSESLTGILWKLVCCELCMMFKGALLSIE